MQPNEKRIILILAALNFTNILDFMIMMPLGNYLMPYFSINPQQFAMLVGSYTLTAACSGFAAAFFVNRYDRKKVLINAYIGFLIGTLACGVAPTYYLLLSARILTGIFGGLIGAQVLSIVADLVPYERRGAAMGAIMSAFAIASTIGVPFALYLSNIFSWHAPFLLVVLLGSVILYFVWRIIPPMKAHIQTIEPPKMEAFLAVVSSPKQRLALLFSGLMMMGHFMIIPFINPYMEFNNGYPKNYTPLIYLVGGIASFASANILGRLSDKYGKMLVFAVSILSSLVFVMAITHLPPIHFGWVLLIFGIWFVLSTGRAVAAQAMVTNVVNPAHRGSFMSFNSSMQQLGTALASFISGAIVLKEPTGKLLHYNWLGYISIAILVTCFCVGQYLFGKNTTVKES
jgi:MFS transporter, DHA1 family, inner membrane transport protein